MDGVMSLIREIWLSVVPQLGAAGTAILGLNLLMFILLFCYVLLKDLQDTLIKAIAYFLDFLLIRVPVTFSSRLKPPANPPRNLYGKQAMSSDEMTNILIILATYGLICMLIVALSAS
jgi:hypothetical protein